MNEPIAIFYESRIVYWNTVLIAVAFFVAFLLGFTLYLRDHSYGIVFCAYWLLTGIGAVYLSRMIHWYCRMEQYPDFFTALGKLENGGYSILGVLLAGWLAAVLLSLLRMVKTRFELLDAAAPGMAFLLAMVRFSDTFSGVCLGKNQIGERKGLFFYTTEIGGIPQTRLAVFHLSFLWLLGVSVISLVLFLLGKKEVYRVFIILFCVSEIFVDSIRYDSLHLFFYGGKLQDLNKVAGFIGLAELAAGLILLGYMFTFFVRMIKKIRRAAAAATDDGTKEPGENGKPKDTKEPVKNEKSKKSKKIRAAESTKNEGELVILEEAQDNEGLEILAEPDLEKEPGTEAKQELGKEPEAEAKPEPGKEPEDGTTSAEPEEKKPRKKTKVLKVLLAVGLLVLFIIGFVIVCVCEYLVQRYTGEYVRWYIVQTIGSFLMGFCCLFSLICIKRL